MNILETFKKEIVTRYSLRLQTDCKETKEQQSRRETSLYRQAHTEEENSEITNGTPHATTKLMSNRYTERPQATA